MVGFRVLVQLFEAGYRVRAAVRTVAGFKKIEALKPIAAYTAQLTYVIVPDITVPGAYDDAVKGVKYVIHIASPLDVNLPDDVDYENDLFQPAIRGTVGMLESANKVTDIERIVMTGSVLSIIGFSDIGSKGNLDGAFPSPTQLDPANIAIIASRGASICSLQRTVPKQNGSIRSIEGQSLGICL